MTLAKMGAHVVGTATTKEGVDRMHAAWAAEGVKAVGAVLDVCDAEALSHVFSTICDNMGAPSIVVNNAGIVRDNLLLRMKDDEWDAVLHTNLKSVFQLSRLCIRPMIKA
ncbi:MAG: SDR family NAD(P)-dependent oxidoreductase, partial [Pseudomonadota bacterium]